MTVSTTRTYIGVGSNLYQPADNVVKAVNRLETVGKLVACSSLYNTKPWGYVEQPDFVNAVAALEVDCSPHELLDRLLSIEQEFGRERLIKWGPRIIDLDILLFGTICVSDSRLSIPHPQMYKRSFVLVPLAEIDSSFVWALRDFSEEQLGEIYCLGRQGVPYAQYVKPI